MAEEEGLALLLLYKHTHGFTLDSVTFVQSTSVALFRSVFHFVHGAAPPSITVSISSLVIMRRGGSGRGKGMGAGRGRDPVKFVTPLPPLDAAALEVLVTSIDDAALAMKAFASAVYSKGERGWMMDAVRVGKPVC